MGFFHEANAFIHPVCYGYSYVETHYRATSSPESGNSSDTHSVPGSRMHIRWPCSASRTAVMDPPYPDATMPVS